MKKLAVGLIAAFLLSMLLTPAPFISAAANEILKGTPVLDGVMDEIYAQSLEISMSEAVVWSPNGTESPVKAVSKLLYDDKYLYVFTSVTGNAELFKMSDDYVLNMSDTNPWQQEATEIWVDLVGDGTKVKVSIDAYGKRVFADSNGIGVESNEYAASCQGKAKIDGTTYYTEIAIPFASAPKAGSSVGFAVQVNDMFAADILDNGGDLVALGSQNPADNMLPLSANSVVLPETTAETTAAPEIVASAPAGAPAATAAQTADAAAIAIFAAIVSIAGVIAVSRKRT